jgi:hypothetical protein
MLLKCTNTSCPDGPTMNPNPFFESNHLTGPVGIRSSQTIPELLSIHPFDMPARPRPMLRDADAVNRRKLLQAVAGFQKKFFSPRMGLDEHGWEKSLKFPLIRVHPCPSVVEALCLTPGVCGGG